MMQFDTKLAAHEIIYLFKFVVVLPDGDEVVYQYEGNSYFTYLIKMREAHQVIENLYQKIERPEVVEF